MRVGSQVHGDIDITHACACMLSNIPWPDPGGGGVLGVTGLPPPTAQLYTNVDLFEFQED